MGVVMQCSPTSDARCHAAREGEITDQPAPRGLIPKAKDVSVANHDTLGKQCSKLTPGMLLEQFSGA